MAGQSQGAYNYKPYQHDYRYYDMRWPYNMYFPHNNKKCDYRHQENNVCCDWPNFPVSSFFHLDGLRGLCGKY